MAAAPDERYQVWIDQSLCTGDGLCVQEAGNVFEFDIDGLAYVKNADGELLTEAGARADVPADLYTLANQHTHKHSYQHANGNRHRCSNRHVHDD